MPSRKASKHGGVIKNGMSNFHPALPSSLLIWTPSRAQNSPERPWDFMWVVDPNGRDAPKHLAHQRTLKRESIVMLLLTDLWFKPADWTKQGLTEKVGVRLMGLKVVLERWKGRKKINRAHSHLGEGLCVAPFKAEAGALTLWVFCLPCSHGRGVLYSGALVLYEAEFESWCLHYHKNL